MAWGALRGVLEAAEAEAEEKIGLAGRGYLGRVQPGSPLLGVLLIYRRFPAYFRRPSFLWGVPWLLCVCGGPAVCWCVCLPVV